MPIQPKNKGTYESVPILNSYAEFMEKTEAEIARLEHKMERHLKGLIGGGSRAEIYRAAQIHDLLLIFKDRVQKLNSADLSEAAYRWAQQVTRMKKGVSGISAAMLAKRCGISRSGMSMFLRGIDPNPKFPMKEAKKEEIRCRLVKPYLEAMERQREQPEAVNSK
ncbi:hypothetical protein IT570_03455 [Candidatus Sumerlaeota bacterium]|nr:hypothetical protein [Candidatus Sumerlaeota bacterium]